MSAITSGGAIERRLQQEAGQWRQKRAITERGEGVERFGLAYAGAGQTGQWFSDWPTVLGSADRDYLPNRYNLVGRSRDLVRNEPVALAAVARRKNAAVGRGWRLSSKPNYRALGIQPEAASELGAVLQTEWKQYAYGYSFQIDAERRLNFGQLLNVAASHLMQDGEYLALVEWAADEQTRYKTRLRMVDPDRLSNPYGRMDTDNLRGGVETNDAGVPIAYWIRERHQLDLGLTSKSFTWTRWERFSTPLGRPQVLHGFSPDRASQTRGVSRFAASLKAFRGLSKFSDATIQSATINALLLGYVQSNAGPDSVSEYFSAEDLGNFEGDREDFYAKNPVKMGDARFINVPLGDDLKFLTASKDVTSYDSFVRSVIRLIAASLGVTYEEVSMDYSTTNYSSARAAMIHAWAETLAFMATLESMLVKPLYVAWMEEAFDAGYALAPAGAPDFYDAIDAYAEGRWIGPGRGYIDPTKEILAAAARIEAGVSTLEKECAEQGEDYEEVLDQTATEIRMRLERNIPATTAAMAQAAEDTKNPFRDAPPPPPSAIGRIRGFADSAEHAAALDARPLSVAA